MLKVGQNVKFDWHVFKQRGVEVAPFDDTMLMSYVLDSGVHNEGHGMDGLTERWLGHKPIAFSEVAGSGRSFIGFARAPIDKATAYAAEDADVTLRLWRALKPRLVAEGMTTVYETLERPLVIAAGAHGARAASPSTATFFAPVGRVRAEHGARRSRDSKASSASRSTSAAPSRSATCCSDRWACPAARRRRPAPGRPTPACWRTWPRRATNCREESSTGASSPSSNRLTPTRCPAYVNPNTQRVHTSFALAATTTGRLSSSEPNLQNIPVRNEEGRRIRRAFVAAAGHKLISADYSQIELRLLAHIADLATLKQAFADGLDIHAMTASEMFGVPIAGMPGEVRRRAKAINFGIIYGISAFGLANQLGIPREEAGAYIRKYFERFPGIRAYMDATKARARKDGFVTTIFGRKCHFPRINASNPSERAFNERAAINAPIQGSAADIIRRAMTRMDAELAHANLSARMLLQVHDELVFEAPDAEVEATIAVAKIVMSQAPAPALSLDVPLMVDARAADNWDEAH